MKRLIVINNRAAGSKLTAAERVFLLVQAVRRGGVLSSPVNVLFVNSETLKEFLIKSRKAIVNLLYTHNGEELSRI